jgi:hypothetical protein
MLFALVAGSTEPANCGLATVVIVDLWIFTARNIHHEEEAWPNFCCSLLLQCSLRLPDSIQEGQGANYGHLLLRAHDRRAPGETAFSYGA